MTEENETIEIPAMSEEPNEWFRNANGTIRFGSFDYDRAWEVAKDAVHYPVAIVNGYWMDEDENIYDATGITASGRDCQFRFILADPYRIGAFQTIACVKDQYGTLNTRSVYETLHDDLKQMGIHAKPHELYITENGGQQRLFVLVDNLSSWDGPDTLQMQIMLKTSVDGSSKHGISAMPFNRTTGAPMPIYGHGYNLEAKHTTTIKDRSINMIPSITSLVGKWDEEIIPMMSLLCDREFDPDSAIEYARELAGEMGLAKKHQDQIQANYESGNLSTNETRHNLYRIVSAISEHVQSHGEDEEQWRNRILDNAEKAMKKEVSRLKKKSS